MRLDVSYATPGMSLRREWPSWARVLGIALVVLGVATRLRLYVTNRSLWLDEVFIALNLRHRSFAELVQPLDFNQAAPLGFLWIEKAMVSCLGDAEWVLRLWPLVVGLASVPLFLALARRTVSPVAGCLAVLLFATSPALNYFSSDTKQYGGDVLYTILVLLCGLSYRDERSREQLVLLVLLGVAAPWLSHAAVFPLAAVGLGLAWDSLRAARWSETFRLIGVGAFWVASLAMAYHVSIGSISADANLQGYWDASFAPLPWAAGAGDKYLAMVLGWFSGNPMPGYGVPGVTLVATLLGTALLARREGRMAVLLGGPVLLVFLASMLHAYPVRARLMLFSAPLLTLLLAIGLEGAWRALRVELPRLGTVFTAVACLVTVTWSWGVLRDGWYREETRDAFAYVQTHVQPGDAVFLDYWTAVSYDYYAPRFDFRGVTPLRAAYFEGSREARRADVARLKGAPRAWIVFSHSDPNGDERRIALGALQDMGKELAPPFERPGVAVYAFDLSAPGG